jgi:acetyl/propionyl-CoA carboxylase alpha subunit
VLRWKQRSIRQRGWAIECRLNAEDPFNNFMPSTGTITRIERPTGPGVRIDSSMYEGYEVTPYYDSLIGKLICWGESRAEAIIRMRRALSEYRIIGVRTNIPFHQAMMDSHRFMGGSFDTTFVEERFELDHEERPEDERIAAVIATLMAHQREQQAAQVVRRNERDTSNWKWIARWERMQR